MEELSEIPLSNSEVLRVLKARDPNKHHKKTLEMIEYLESVKNDKFPMNIIRTLKNEGLLEASMMNLVMLSNTSDTTLVSSADLKIINQNTNK
jgi:hypothetical protein